MDAIERIRIQLELEGYEPGTEAFEKALRSEKVLQCQVRRSVASCFACEHYEHCSLAKEYLLDERDKSYKAGYKRGKAHAMALENLREIGLLGDEKDPQT